MTINIASASTGNSGVLSTLSVTYSLAQSGTGATTANSTNQNLVGQIYTGSTYECLESFYQFPYTLDTTVMIDDAYITYTAGVAPGGAVSWNAEVRQYAYGTFSTSSWRTPSQLTALTEMTEVDSVFSISNAEIVSGGGPNLTVAMQTTGPLQFVVSSSRMRAGSTPTGNEYGTFGATNTSAGYPTLVWSTIPVSQLCMVGGAQAQLSDGTTVCLMNSSASNVMGSTPPALYCVSSTGTATLISNWPASAPIGSTQTRGYQGFALVTDASDNIYVITSINATQLCVIGYAKGSGLTWSPGIFDTQNVTSTTGRLDSWAATWHSVGTTGGTIVAIATASPQFGTIDSGGTGAQQVVFIDAGYALALPGNSGSLVRANIDADNIFSLVTSGWNQFRNETMTGVDICAAPGTTNQGYAISYDATDTYSGSTPAICAYTVSASGNSFSTAVSSNANLTTVKRDANSKLRVLGISSTLFAVAGGMYPFQVYQNSGGSISLQGSSTLLGTTAATVPSEIYDHTLWDVVYDTAGNQLWFYYISNAAPNTLKRTAFLLGSLLPTGVETTITTSAGSASGTNVSLRATRGALHNANTIIDLAYTLSGSAVVQHIPDAFTYAPTTPTLTAHANFDATTSQTLAWTYNNPNPADLQGSFEIDIETASGTAYFDTGQISNAISFVGVGAAASANNASATPGLPASYLTGDLLLTLASSRSTAASVSAAGWTQLVQSQNVSILGQIATASTTAPVVNVIGGSAGADTLAQVAAFRGAYYQLSGVMASSGVSINTSAQNMVVPSFVSASTGYTDIIAGWKQTTWTSISQPYGTAIASPLSVVGSSAGMSWDYALNNTGSGTTASAVYTVTGGTSQVSKGLALVLKPALRATVSSFTVPANLLTNPGSWQWRIRTWDSAGLQGPWSSYSTFQTSAAGTVTITDPATDNPGGFNTSSYTVHWSVAGTTQVNYTINVIRTDTSAVVYSSGTVTSTATSAVISGLVTGVQQQIQITVQNSSFVNSGTGLRYVTPSFASPDTPIIAVTPQNSLGYTLVQISNPAPTGSEPAVINNSVYRGVFGGTFTKLGNVANNGQYVDYTAASGVAYTYYVIGAAASGVTVTSASVVGTLTLMGRWIHVASTPATTLYNFPYGIGRTTALDVLGVANHYAGREYAVVDYGQYADNTIMDVVDSPVGNSYAGERQYMETFAGGKVILCYRDNTGRKQFCTMNTYTENDYKWGCEYTFTLLTVDYSEAVA